MSAYCAFCQDKGTTNELLSELTILNQAGPQGHVSAQSPRMSLFLCVCLCVYVFDIHGLLRLWHWALRGSDTICGAYDGMKTTVCTQTHKLKKCVKQLYMLETLRTQAEFYTVLQSSSSRYSSTSQIVGNTKWNTQQKKLNLHCCVGPPLQNRQNKAASHGRKQTKKPQWNTDSTLKRNKTTPL